MTRVIIHSTVLYYVYTYIPNIVYRLLRVVYEILDVPRRRAADDGRNRRRAGGRVVRRTAELEQLPGRQAELEEHLAVDHGRAGHLAGRHAADNRVLAQAHTAGHSDHRGGWPVSSSSDSFVPLDCGGKLLILGLLDPLADLLIILKKVILSIHFGGVVNPHTTTPIPL